MRSLTMDDGQRGATTIADSVVRKIAGVAARDVDGVYALGGGAAGFGAVRGSIPGASTAGSGVTVEVGERQAAVDLQIQVEYGESIADLVRSVQDGVTAAIQQATGLEVVQVDVTVNDVHVPGDDENADSAGRVR